MRSASARRGCARSMRPRAGDTRRHLHGAFASGPADPARRRWIALPGAVLQASWNQLLASVRWPTGCPPVTGTNVATDDVGGTGSVLAAASRSTSGTRHEPVTMRLHADRADDRRG